MNNFDDTLDSEISLSIDKIIDEAIANAPDADWYEVLAKTESKKVTSIFSNRKKAYSYLSIAASIILVVTVSIMILNSVKSDDGIKTTDDKKKVTPTVPTLVTTSTEPTTTTTTLPGSATTKKASEINTTTTSATTTTTPKSGTPGIPYEVGVFQRNNSSSTGPTLFLKVQWSVDDTNVTNFRIYKDGVLLKQIEASRTFPATNSYSFGDEVGNFPGASYNYNVSAVNSVGVESGLSATVTYTIS